MIHAEIRQPTPAEIAARRARLMGAAQQRPKVPSLTLVKTEHVVVKKNVGGRPRSPKPRPDANEHVRDYRLHMLNRREILTPLDYVKMRCLQERVAFELLIGTARQQGIVEFRWALCVEVKERWPHLSSPQMGKIFNRDHTTILWAMRRRVPNGPRHQICKEKVEEILRLVSEGTSKREAARLVGISEETVRRIVIPGYRERRNEQNRRRKTG